MRLDDAEWGALLGLAIICACFIGSLWITKDNADYEKEKAMQIAQYVPLLYENGTYERRTLEDALKEGCGCEHWFEDVVAKSNDSLFEDALLIVCVSKNTYTSPSTFDKAYEHVVDALIREGIIHGERQ